MSEKFLDVPLSEVDKDWLLSIFKEEIKGIKSIREKIDGTIAVVDEGKLQNEDREVWDKYKDIFIKIDLSLRSLDWGNLKKLKQGQPNKLQFFLDSLTDLVGSAKDRRSKAEDESSKQFMAWIINRLAILLGDIDSLNSDDCQEEDFIDIKNNTLSQERNIVGVIR